MATTINSGYANSPKLTANIADHADVYGGRALVFDGVSDYLDCGTGLGNQLGDNYSGGLSVSMWINVDSSYSSGQKGVFFIGNFGGSYGEFTITINPTNFSLYLNQNGWQKNFNYTARDTWTHICFVADSQSESNTKFYIDGEIQSIATNVANTFPSSGDLDFSGLKTVIGNFFNGNYPFHGKITDTKVFNSALTEAQVQELYKKPENTPSAVQDNLVAWYPMIEGNPESPQSIVYDHSEKKLGASEITSASNTTFSGVSSNDWTSSGATKSFSNDQMVFTMDGDSPAVVAQLSSGNFVGGSGIPLKFLKVTLDVDSTTTGSYRINNAGGSCSANVFEKNPLTTGINTVYGLCDGANSYFRILEADVSTGDKLVLNSFDVKEVLMGNHATTNFFGDELVTNGDFELDSNWADKNTPTVNERSTEQANGGTYSRKFTADAISDGIQSDTFSVTAGITYKVSVDVYPDDNTQIRVVLRKGDGSHADADNSYTSLTQDAWNTLEFTYVAELTGSGTYIIILSKLTSGTYYIDNVTVKEVGVSSSGFETAVNEPVVPQVPLMRYNQKVFFNGDNGSDTEVLWNDIGGAFASSKFTLSVVHLGRDTDEITTIFDITESAYTDYIRLFRNNSGRYYVYIENANSSQTIYEYASYADDANFHHIVLTCDGSKWCFYINGYKEREESHTHTTAHLTHTTTDMRVGMIGTGSESYRAIGIIDELSLWNTALTYDEVKELYADSVVKDATTHSKKGNLLGYWRNDGVTTWKDRRGWSFLDFDGTGDYVAIGSAIGDMSGKDVSVTVWFNSRDIIQVRGIISQQDGTGTGRYLLYTESNKLKSFLGGAEHSVSTNLQANQWHHACYTMNSSTNEYKLYLDGQLGDSGTDAIESADGDFFIGTSKGLGSAVFNGGIAQLALFDNKTLSPDEVLEQYNNGVANNFTTEGMTHHYVFNNDTTIVDLINGSNGTINGNPTFNDGNDGDVQGSPDSITIREGLNSNRDGLGFYFTNPSSNVLRLNGIDEHLILPYTKSFDMGDGSFTVSAWVKTTLGVGDSIQTILWARDNDDSFKGFEFQIDDSADRPRFILSDGSGGECNGITNSVESDKWHFVAVVVDKENDLAKIFLSESDGSALKCQTTTDISARGNINATPDWYIGKRNGATTQDFMGIIDELMVYNIALTALESDGTTVEAGDTVTSGELLKNYKFSKGKHKND